jgi:hypothetical protein
LLEIINNDQTTFLSLIFILDNVFLPHERIDWAKKFNQPLVLLKINFAKAYGKGQLGIF